MLLSRERWFPPLSRKCECDAPSAEQSALRKKFSEAGTKGRVSSSPSPSTLMKPSLGPPTPSVYTAIRPLACRSVEGLTVILLPDIATIFCESDRATATIRPAKGGEQHAAVGVGRVLDVALRLAVGSR